MKSKKTPSKKIPPITDPQLVALLSYINDHKSEETLDAIADLSRRILTTGHPASAFECHAGRPQIVESVIERNRAAMAESESQDDKDAWDALSDTEGEDFTLRREVLFNVAVSCISEATLVGACLMYHILRGTEVRR